MCLDPMLTLEELPEVIDLTEAAARPHRERTDRLDLHQLLADLYRRLVSVQGRQLASAADLDLWSTADGRDVLLGRCITEATVRNHIRRNALAADPPLRARVRAAAAPRPPVPVVRHGSTPRPLDRAAAVTRWSADTRLGYAFAVNSRKSRKPEALTLGPARGPRSTRTAAPDYWGRVGAGPAGGAAQSVSDRSNR